ncbi:cupin domain-containing protein [Paraburkholderia pallida]|uniref:Cupin domain-containing protein n=1 Tax=Paraburkholderia pallida TaxID=2547399 RepID=A0A4P7D5T5_9BURK|nr:cupin domain-containing protein [Paraburkholderia pallida]QBR04136.1 cupin domain-containing protein [Paraburkholderia pallida]
MFNTKPDIRRIVTSHDADGQSVVWIDGVATNSKRPTSKTTTTLIWATNETPADFLSGNDSGEQELGVPPPASGSRFSVVEFEVGNEPHGLHRTDSIDYVICLAGELELVLDSQTVRVRPGDIVVQRGTRHAWINRGTVPARIAVVLIDGKPKRIGSLSGAQFAP